jgi:hypothetical protein
MKSKRRAEGSAYSPRGRRGIFSNQIGTFSVDCLDYSSTLPLVECQSAREPWAVVVIADCLSFVRGIERTSERNKPRGSMVRPRRKLVG